MSPRKKVAISSFVQSGNFEIASQAGFEPVTLRVTVRPLIHYTKFPYGKKFKKIKPNSNRYLQSFCSRVASRIEQQSAISFEETKSKNG